MNFNFSNMKKKMKSEKRKNSEEVNEMRLETVMVGDLMEDFLEK